jgi:hypothetical protein
MITKDQALQLQHGDTVHFGQCLKLIGARGATRIQSEQWRISGKLHTWKTRPEQWVIAIKFGLYQSSCMTNNNAENFHLPSECNCIDKHVTSIR